MPAESASSPNDRVWAVPWGDRVPVLEDRRPCTFAPCPQPAVASVPLLVDGRESVVAVCRDHADWLRDYVDEDAGVELLPDVAEDPDATAGEDDVEGLA